MKKSRRMSTDLLRNSKEIRHVEIAKIEAKREVRKIRERALVDCVGKLNNREFCRP